MSAPSTPRHSRQSTIDSQVMSTASSPENQRPSKPPYNEPTTPTRHLRPSFSHNDGLDVFSSGGMGGAIGGGGGMGGLGNLADELADALSDGEDDEDGDEYYDEEDNQGQQLGGGSGNGAPPDISLSEAEDGEGGGGGRRREGARGGEANGAGQHDSGVDVASASSPRGGGGLDGTRARNASLSLPSTNGGGGGGRGGARSRGHKRVGSAYDGSEYGSDSDLDSPGMPTSLVAKIDAVESLARRGTEDNGGPTDGVCKRLTEELRDLGSQSGVEGGASRLITAHSALTTHLTHQTRQLHALAFPLFSPLAATATVPLVGLAISRNAEDSDDEGTEDDLLPMLTSLADHMPRPSTAAYQSLTALHGLTSDLVSTLNYLSDTLHMARQTTTTATRRLRSAKELVAEMRRDEDLREEGERWLVRGNWDERLQRRECAHVCVEVVGGFEEVCNGWRARLLAQAEAAQASA